MNNYLSAGRLCLYFTALVEVCKILVKFCNGKFVGPDGSFYRMSPLLVQLIF
jgi:hypothetical protein